MDLRRRTAFLAKLQKPNLDNQQPPGAAHAGEAQADGMLDGEGKHSRKQRNGRSRQSKHKGAVMHAACGGSPEHESWEDAYYLGTEDGTTMVAIRAVEHAAEEEGSHCGGEAVAARLSTLLYGVKGRSGRKPRAAIAAAPPSVQPQAPAATRGHGRPRPQPYSMSTDADAPAATAATTVAATGDPCGQVVTLRVLPLAARQHLARDDAALVPRRAEQAEYYTRKAQLGFDRPGTALIDMAHTALHLADMPISAALVDTGCDIAGISRPFYQRLCKEQGIQPNIGHVRMRGIVPGVSQCDMVVEPLPLTFNRGTTWEISLPWPRWVILDNLALPDVLLDTSVVRALSLTILSDGTACYPLDVARGLHGPQAVVPFRTLGTAVESLHLEVVPTPQPVVSQLRLNKAMSERDAAELDLQGAALHELRMLFLKRRRGKTSQLMGVQIMSKARQRRPQEAGARRHRVDALDLLDAAHRTLEAVGDADEVRLTYLRRFKAKKALTPEEQVAERLIYSRVSDTAEHERSANVVDGLLAALEDKRLEVGLAAAAKAHASAIFKRQAAERDTDRDKARKEKDKAARETRREQQRREADTKNCDKNGGSTGDKTRD
eukprot:jgi/Tetstr1/426960/TSEL_017173.t1